MDETLQQALQVHYIKLYFKVAMIENTTLPEHKVSALRGGIGEMLGKLLLENGFKGVYKTFAIADEFVKQGTQKEQRALYGLDSDSIINAVF